MLMANCYQHEDPAAATSQVSQVSLQRHNEEKTHYKSGNSFEKLPTR